MNRENKGIHIEKTTLFHKKACSNAYSMMEIEKKYGFLLPTIYTIMAQETEKRLFARKP